MFFELDFISALKKLTIYKYYWNCLAEISIILVTDSMLSRINLLSRIKLSVTLFVMLFVVLFITLHNTIGNTVHNIVCNTFRNIVCNTVRNIVHNIVCNAVYNTVCNTINNTINNSVLTILWTTFSTIKQVLLIFLLSTFWVSMYFC